jgi:hypothetical protein
LVKTDANGAATWTHTFSDNAYDYGYCVETTSDGGYIIAGETFNLGTANQGLIIKTNSSGVQTWATNFGATFSYQARGVLPVADGYIVVGASGTTLDFYLLKLNWRCRGMRLLHRQYHRRRLYRSG